MEELGGPGVHAPQRRLPPGRRRRARRGAPPRATCSAYLPRRSATAAAARRRRGRPSGDPAAPRARRGAQGLRRPRRDRARSSTAASCSSSRPRWARNMVTALARIDGRPVGVIANQPRHLGGVIDAAAAEKGALFVDACDRFGLPLVVLVDTPGFMPGTPPGGGRRDPPRRRRCCAPSPARRCRGSPSSLRKAYGGAVITMNSKDLGADMVFAWPRRRDRDHGRRARRSGSSTAAARRGRRRRGCPPSSPPPTPAEHLTAEAAAASGLRRRGDRARARPTTASPGRLRRAGGTMTAVDPMSRHRRAAARSAPAVERPRSAPTPRSATASPPAPAARRASAGPTGSRPGSPPAARGFVLPQPRGRGRDQRPRCSSSSAAALQLEPDLVTVVCGANDVLFSVRPDAEAYARRPRRHLPAPARRAPVGRGS